MKTRIAEISARKKPLGMLAKAIDFVSPALATNFATSLFLYPGRYRLSDGEKQLLQKGEQLRLHYGKHELRGWRWGSGPAVLLVHGWGGRAVQYAGLIEALCAQGYSVIGFDLPGHGDSKGRQPTLVDFCTAIEKVADMYGPFDACISHSIGALASSMVLRDKPFARRMVLLSPLSGAGYAVRKFASMTGVSLDITARMQKRLEKRYQISFDDCDFKQLGGELSAPMLVIHDRHDRITPFEGTQAWIGGCQSADLFGTENLGHLRILSDSTVLTRVGRFLGVPRGNVREQMLSEYAL